MKKHPEISKQRFIFLILIKIHVQWSCFYNLKRKYEYKSSILFSIFLFSVEAYKQTIKKTGEYFPLSLVTGISYYTITSDNPNEKV